jgi:hypothetical protein
MVFDVSHGFSWGPGRLFKQLMHLRAEREPDLEENSFPSGHQERRTVERDLSHGHHWA